MRPRWAREMIEEMRRDNAARVAELERWREQHERWREEDKRRHEDEERRHEQWRAEFEEYRSEWRARVEADRVECATACRPRAKAC